MLTVQEDSSERPSSRASVGSTKSDTKAPSVTSDSRSQASLSPGRGRVSMAGPPLANVQEDWPLSPPWRGVKQIALAHAGKGKGRYAHLVNMPSIFGPDALTEVLAAVTFAHLCFYGNDHQKCMSSYQRAVWLLTYMRSVLHHLNDSFLRRDGDKKDLLECSPLEKVLRKLFQGKRDSEVWSRTFEDLAPDEDDAKLFPKPTARPGLPPMPEDLRCLVPSTKDLLLKKKDIKMGTQYVTENGLCRLCEQEVDEDGWGNPLCPGCSCVDQIPFQCHPLAALLIDRHPDWKIQACKATHIRNLQRCALTPPPMGVSSAFEGQGTLEEK